MEPLSFQRTAGIGTWSILRSEMLLQSMKQGKSSLLLIAKKEETRIRKKPQRWLNRANRPIKRRSRLKNELFSITRKTVILNNTIGSMKHYQ